MTIHSADFYKLGEEFPEAVDRLDELAEYLARKQKRLDALKRFCAEHEDLPMVEMYAEFRAALDTAEHEPSKVVKEASDEEAMSWSTRKQKMRVARLRQRERIVSNAAYLITIKPWDWVMAEVAMLSGTTRGGVGDLFSRAQLTVAAYEYLIANGLS